MGFDSRATIRRIAHAATVLAAAVLVAGCFQPLYGDRSVTGSPRLQEALSGVQVMEIRAAANTPEARMAVPLQNDLRFNFTGLGLSVVADIIQQHQGWTEVASEAGKGSTFQVFLPAWSSGPADLTSMSKEQA